MKKLFLTIFATVLVLTLSPPSAFAQDYDVGGLKIGMSQTEVETIISENGYEPYFKAGRKTHIQTAPTFEQAVQQKQGKYFPKKNQEGLGSLVFQKDNREVIGVQFREFPSGPVVIGVSYSLRDKTITQPVFVERVASKYGKADQNTAMPDTSTWLGDEDIVIDGISIKETLRRPGIGLNLTGLVNSVDYNTALNATTPAPKGSTSF